MSSSLAKQLNQLKAQQPTLQLVGQQNIQAPSLLFSHKVSTGIDIDTVYSIALQGFQNLIQTDARFGKYQDVIFGSQNKRLDRMTLTEDTNTELSKQIKGFMILLSLYMINEDGQKVYDYLLRNFKVHVFEKEECVIYNLHYSSTTVFNRLIQNIELKSSKHFSFLQRFAEKDQILYRSTLVKQITYDSYILEQLIKYNEKISKLKQSTDIVIPSEHSKLLTKITPQPFLLAILTELLGVKKSNENFINLYSETIGKFITSPKKVDQLSFALTLLISLVVKERNKISKDLIKYFVDYLFSTFKMEKVPKICQGAIFKTLIFLAQRGFVYEISQENLFYFVQFSLQNSKQVEKVLKNYSTLPFVLEIVKSYFEGLRNKENEKEEFQINVQEIVLVFTNLFSNILGTDHCFKYSQQIRNSFCNEIFEQYFNQENNDEKLVEILKKFFQSELIQFVVQKINKKEEKYIEFSKEHYPSLLQLLEKKSQLFSFDISDLQQEEDEISKKLSLKALLQGLKNDDKSVLEFNEYFINTLIYQLQISKKKSILALVLECLSYLKKCFRESHFSQVLNEVIKICETLENQESLQEISNQILQIFDNLDQDNEENGNLLVKLHLVLIGRNIQYQQEQVQNKLQLKDLLFQQNFDKNNNNNSLYVNLGISKVLIEKINNNNSEEEQQIISQILNNISQFGKDSVKYNQLEKLSQSLISLISQNCVQKFEFFNFLLTFSDSEFLQNLKSGFLDQEKEKIQFLIENILQLRELPINKERQILNLKMLLILNNYLGNNNNNDNDNNNAENVVNFVVQILFSQKTESNEKKVIFNIIQNVLKNCSQLSQIWKQFLQFIFKNRISLQVQNSDYKKILFNANNNQQLQQIKWKQILDQIINNEKLQNFSTEVIINLPDIFQDDYKFKFMDIVGKNSKNYFLVLFSLVNINNQFEKYFLEALTVENLSFSLFALSSEIFTEKLESQNQFSLLKHLVSTNNNLINQENYASVLNHLSDFTFNQEIINFFVEFLNSYILKEENQESYLQFKFILEVLIYQKDKNNVLNIASLFNIVKILVSQDQNDQQIQQNLHLVLKLVRMQKSLQIASQKDDVLGKFENNSYENLKCLENILQRQELKEAFNFDLSKTCVDILGQIACINFKYTSNIVFDFLFKQQQVFLAVQNNQNNNQNQEEIQESKEEKENKERTKKQNDEIRMEQLNDLYNYSVGEILRRNPDKQEKCVKFMHAHLKIFWILLKTYQNGSDKKENRSIKRKAEIIIIQIMKLYGQENLEIILLSAITNIFKDDENTENVLNLFLQILLQNFFKAGNPSILFGKSLVKLQNFVIQILFQYCDIKSAQSTTQAHQKFCLVAKTFNVFHNKQGQKMIMKYIQLLFKLIFSNPIFLKMLEQVVLHKCGQEFLQELSQLYQSILRYEVKIKNCLTEIMKEKPSDKKELQEFKQTKQFLKLILANCKSQSQYIANILPFDYYLSICAFGLEQTQEYSIKQHILEKIGIKLENTQIRKRQHEKIEKILQILMSDLTKNKNTFLDPKKKLARGYLQQVILFYIQILQKKQTLMKCLDLDNFIVILMDYFNKMDCFVFKNSMILLFSCLSSLNKYKILENLSEIMKELFIEFLAVFKFAPQKKRSLLNINEILLEKYPKIFEQVNLESLEKEISRPNIMKNKENLVASNVALFKMLINATQQFIESLQNLMTPYLLPLQHISLYFADLEQKAYAETVEEYMVKNVELVSSRVLLEKTISIMEICQKVSPFAVKSIAIYLAHLFEKLDAAEIEEFQTLIFKKYVIFLDYTRKHFVNQEEYDEVMTFNIEKYQVEAFSNFILKTNEVQLRKIFLNLVTWSEKVFQENESGYQFTQYRKVVLNKLIIHLMDCLGQLFVPFYIFVFENTLKSLAEIKKYFTVDEEELENNNIKKRKQDDNDTHKQLKVVLLKLQIQSLKALFEHDKDNFLDQQKIQALADPLFDIYEANVLPNYIQFTEQYLIPSVISLFDGISDDYKWKHINYNLILRSRSENNQVKLALLKTLTGLVDVLGDRFIVLINDLLPFLSETIDDTNNEVEALSKQLVVKLENLSGENLKEYFKSQR